LTLPHLKILIAVRRELNRGAQIMFGNLEGTLTTATAGKCASMHARPGACLAFRDPPGYVRYLKHAGITVFSDANPHSFRLRRGGAGADDRRCPSRTGLHRHAEMVVLVLRGRRRGRIACVAAASETR